jgi:hypothetical protein
MHLEKSAKDFFWTAHDIVACGHLTMLNLLFGPNPISDDELRRLITKRPAVYAKYAAYLEKR